MGVSIAGVKLLVQLAEGDLPILDFLNDYLQEFLDGSFHGNTEFYLRSHQFVSQLERFYRLQNSECPYYLLSFFRHIITLISETLFLSATSDVCKVAIDSIIVTSPKVKVKLRDLISNVENMQDLTIRLEIDIIKHIRDKNDFQMNQFDSKAIMTQTEQIWRLVRSCETPLKQVTMAVEQKASADRTFFQRASLGVGAVCAGKIPFYCSETFPKQIILYSSKVNEFAEDYFKFDGNSEKCLKWVGNTLGKGEIARYERFLLFPQCFQKTFTEDT